jgi:hypothetical protein
MTLNFEAWDHYGFGKNRSYIAPQGFQNNPAAAGAPAGGTMFTAGYFV